MSYSIFGLSVSFEILDRGNESGLFPFQVVINSAGGITHVSYESTMQDAEDRVNELKLLHSDNDWSEK